MNENNELTVIPKLSIRPNSFTFYNQIVRNSKFCKDENTSLKEDTNLKDETIKENRVKQPKINYHNFEISVKASKRIKEKISWLYALSKNKTVTTHNGKSLSSFKINFITLTLPSIQRHSTDIILEKCLHQFFVECKERLGLTNYVWRLEFQKNGNAHFHIATDTYTDYYVLRRIWNRIINKLDYVNEYGKKFEKMSLKEYIEIYKNEENSNFETLKKRYIYGKSTKWMNPNTVNVKCVTNANNISFYIAKYITKKSEGSLNPIVSERENMISNLRLWFCSRSLSKVEKITVFLEAIPERIGKIFENLREINRIFHEYVEVWYFDIKKQSNEFKRDFRDILIEYAIKVGYA